MLMPLANDATGAERPGRVPGALPGHARVPGAGDDAPALALPVRPRPLDRIGLGGGRAPCGAGCVPDTSRQAPARTAERAGRRRAAACLNGSEAGASLAVVLPLKRRSHAAGWLASSVPPSACNQATCLHGFYRQAGPLRHVTFIEYAGWPVGCFGPAALARPQVWPPGS